MIRKFNEALYIRDLKTDHKPFLKKIQRLYILTKNAQSPSTRSFSVSGTEREKICLTSN